MGGVYEWKRPFVCQQVEGAEHEDYRDCCGGYPAGDFYTVFFCGEVDKIPDAENRGQAKKACDRYCDEVSSEPDCCPSGLSPGAIAGMVIAAVVVVAGVAALLVYFLVFRKTKVVNPTGGEPPNP
jgi:hypothetical protein